MKKFFSHLKYLSLAMVFLTFTACQEEFEEIGGNEEETIEVGSSTASLIVNTSARDGSYDNIVDGASCFAIQFPYTVEVAGIQITIDSIEDLRIIEELFDEVDTDDDIVDIFFPITITFSDHTELVIENKEQLRELAAECIEGGDDDDIECIDFVYPITLFTFDVNAQQSGSVTVNSDKEMRQFFANLEANALVSIDFPITLKKYDGTEIVVENNAQLAAALEAAKDECDEDDDDDYNDDDFDRERFLEYFTECPWELRDIRRDGIDQTDQYREYLFYFGEDGAVEVVGQASNVLMGEWEFEFTPNGLKLTMAFDNSVDFSLTWYVYEIEDGKIKFYSDNDNRIILRRHCDDDGGTGEDPNTLREILKECAWIIKKVKNQGEEIDRLLGYEFKFMAEGVVTLSNGITVSEGTWEVGLNSEAKLALLIEFGSEPSINFEWPLRDLDDDRLKFEVEEIDYELVLQRVCDDNANDGDVAEIRNIMMGGAWNVALYEEGEVNATAEFAGYDFYFKAMNEVQVDENDNPIITGLWRVLRNNDNELKFYLNFENDAVFGEITEDWKIVSVTASRLELMDTSGDGSAEVLVFERI